MAKTIILDTDVLVDYLRGSRDAAAFIKSRAEQIVLSPVVIAELYAGVRENEERAKLDDLIALFPVAPVSAGIAKAAGLLKRDYGKSHGIGLADAIVASTAQAAGAEVCTLNTRHYPMFKGIKPPYTK